MLCPLGYALADAGALGLPVCCARINASCVSFDVRRISGVVVSRGSTGAVGNGDTRPRSAGGTGDAIRGLGERGLSATISRDKGWAVILGRSLGGGDRRICCCCTPRGSAVAAGAERGKREVDWSMMLQDGLGCHLFSDCKFQPFTSMVLWMLV